MDAVGVAFRSAHQITTAKLSCYMSSRFNMLPVINGSKILHKLFLSLIYENAADFKRRLNDVSIKK